MNLKLGKLPYREDQRTLKLRLVMKAELPPIPEAFSVDQSLGGIQDNYVYGNDRYGCCAVAAVAHHTLRFEDYEQGRQIDISTADVLTWYWRLQGWKGGCWLDNKPDNGLVMLDVLKDWRGNGWKAAGGIYKNYAYGLVNWKDHEDVKAAIYLLNGAYVGIMLPKSAQTQYDLGLPWAADESPDGSWGSWGGHAVYVFSYDQDGLTCMTWGKRQKLSWAFWDKYVEECWAIIDRPNKADSIVDCEKLEAYLAQIKGG